MLAHSPICQNTTCDASSPHDAAKCIMRLVFGRKCHAASTCGGAIRSRRRPLSGAGLLAGALAGALAAGVLYRQQVRLRVAVGCVTTEVHAMD